MIHLNKGDKPHEWVTREELEKRYPKLAKSLKEKTENPLAKIRAKKRITVRQLSKITGLTIQEIINIETDKIKDQERIDKYIMGIQN